MSFIELKFGNTSLKLEKSESLVGVRARRGREDVILRSADRVGAKTTHESVGGFELLDVRTAAQPMEAALDVMRANPDVGAGTHVYYTSEDRVPFVPTGHVYIEFAKHADPKKCDAILGRLALEIVESRGPHELVARVTSQSPNPLKVAAALQESGLVDVAEPELASPGKASAFAIPSDPHLTEQWHLRNTGSINGSKYRLKAGADARVLAAWQRAGTMGSRQVVVAVIDDGFDLRHRDLSGPDKIVSPWDFTRNSADPSPTKNDPHGTSCAGVAVGNANAYGIVGAAPGCRWMPIRWGVDLADSQIERWFGYAKDQGAWIVSCSWGAAARNFPLSVRATKAISRCASEGRNGLGCVIVFAAGNENMDINDPVRRTVNGFAIHPNVIAVAASTSTDERSDYSNYGKEISVCAPSSGAGGRGVFTSDVSGQLGYSSNAFTSDFGGTSSACPLVAGICGLLLSVRPTLTAVQVKDMLQRTARKIGPTNSYDAHGHSRHFGYGCVDAEKAIGAPLSGDGKSTGSRPKRKKRKTKVSVRR